MTFPRGLYLVALILFIVAAVICFLSTDVTQNHIIGIIAAGLACVAAAPLAS